MSKCFHHFLVGPLVLFMLGSLSSYAQNTDTSRALKNGISRPNVLATHPFGLLFYTLPHNFRMAPEPSGLDISLNSGNIWGQPVDVYIPINEVDRVRMQEIPFFDRIYAFDTTLSPSETYQIQYDGVIKDFRMAYSFAVGEKNSISLSGRSFLLTEGTFPGTVFTGDRFIEFFHGQIAGGDDPFGRRERGLDQAGVEYVDRNGRSMTISQGEFVFSGIEFAYYHFPKIFSRQKIHVNLGAHIGTNLSRYNRSMDFGFSIAGVKSFTIAHKDLFQIGFGLNALRRSLILFNTDQTDLGTSSFLGSLETHLEYAFQTSKSSVHSFGLNYRIQTPYNKKEEEDYYVPVSPERIARWHEAAGHLYKFPSYWSLIYSFTKKLVFSIYLQQDMLVNNVPDFQTGIQLTIPLNKQR